MLYVDTKSKWQNHICNQKAWQFHDCFHDVPVVEDPENPLGEGGGQYVSKGHQCPLLEC